MSIVKPYDVRPDCIGSGIGTEGFVLRSDSDYFRAMQKCHIDGMINMYDRPNWTSALGSISDKNTANLTGKRDKWADIVVTVRIYNMTAFRAYDIDSNANDLYANDDIKDMVSRAFLADWTFATLKIDDANEVLRDTSGNAYAARRDYDRIYSIVDNMVNNLIIRNKEYFRVIYGVEDFPEPRYGIAMLEGRKHGIIIEPTWCRGRGLAEWMYTDPLRESLTQMYDYNESGKCVLNSRERQALIKMVGDFEANTQFPPLPFIYAPQSFEECFGMNMAESGSIMYNKKTMLRPDVVLGHPLSMQKQHVFYGN